MRVLINLPADSDGNTFRGKWHYSEARGRWEGNPVHLAEVDDMMVAIRHKCAADGNERTHSGAMSKEYMDRILTWSEASCLLNVPLSYIRDAMAGLPVPSLGKEAKWLLTQRIEMLAFSALAFMIWTRYIINSRLLNVGVNESMVLGTTNW